MSTHIALVNWTQKGIQEIAETHHVSRRPRRPLQLRADR